jgi:small subunit ribosomal protein S20
MGKKSAQKELRKSLKRRERNLKRKEAIKKAVKEFKKLLEENKFEEAKRQLNLVYKALDKAAKTNVIHKNKAARLKSKYAKLLVKAEKK